MTINKQSSEKLVKYNDKYKMKVVLNFTESRNKKDEESLLNMLQKEFLSNYIDLC